MADTPQSILVIGNLGYVGPVLIEAYRRHFPGDRIVGFDNGYFEASYSAPLCAAELPDELIHGDVRRIDPGVFNGVDTVVYLAAVSNDPMGREFANATHEINTEAAITAAEVARSAGARRFVFASSCSVYGAGGELPKTEDDPLDPLSDYATSKIEAENELRRLAGGDFSVSCLRFATACGPSPRLRLDLVLNDFVATAMIDARIEVLSDGSPLRPLIDVRDMASAIIWATRTTDFVDNFLVLNVGSNEWNFSVLELATMVARDLEISDVSVNTEAGPDNRSYRVDFSRYRELSGAAYPRRLLSHTIKDLRACIEDRTMFGADFRGGPLIRLNVLRRHLMSGAIDSKLRWKPK